MTKITNAELVTNISNWLIELRSDKHSQGQGCLEDVETGELCCLGVGCKHVLNLRRESKSVMTMFYYGKSVNYELMPGNSWQLLGLINRYGESYIPSNYSLVILNDAGVSFKKIAELLELDLRTGYEGYFSERAKKAWRKYYGFTLKDCADA